MIENEHRENKEIGDQSTVTYSLKQTIIIQQYLLLDKKNNTYVSMTRLVNSSNIVIDFFIIV